MDNEGQTISFFSRILTKEAPLIAINDLVTTLKIQIYFLILLMFGF